MAGSISIDERLVFSREELEQLGTDLLVGLGTPSDIARLVADSLVLSNLVGHDSHGIVRLVQYAGWVRDGQIRPDVRPMVRERRGAVAVVDGGWGFGQPAAQLATTTASESAKSHGISCVTIMNCNHIGRVGEYVDTMADAQLMGLAFCNSGPAVAPFGGTARVMGTNPFAWSVPRQGTNNLVLDFATSIVAEGKLNIARSEGRSVAPGYIVDRDGRPSIDPNDYFAGGALLPFGLHKGSGMSMLIELTSGLLSHMGVSSSPDYQGGNGTMIIGLDVALFGEIDGYLEEVEQFCRDAKVTGPGTTGAEVLVPGDVEERNLADRSANGIVVNDEIRRQITAVADSCGVAPGRFGLR